MCARKNQPPVASLMHFLVKLFLAAPASFLSAACASHVAVAVAKAAAASFSHFCTKLFLAAPASFLSAACASHVAAKEGALKAIRARVSEAVNFFIGVPWMKANTKINKISNVWQEG